MNKLTIWFKANALDFNEGDPLFIDVMDVVLQQGFLVAFLPEDENGNHITNAYNIECIDSWQFVQVPKGEEDGEESVCEE